VTSWSFATKSGWRARHARDAAVTAALVGRRPRRLGALLTTAASRATRGLMAGQRRARGRAWRPDRRGVRRRSHHLRHRRAGIAPGVAPTTNCGGGSPPGAARTRFRLLRHGQVRPLASSASEGAVTWMTRNSARPSARRAEPLTRTGAQVRLGMPHAGSALRRLRLPGPAPSCPSTTRCAYPVHHVLASTNRAPSTCRWIRAGGGGVGVAMATSAPAPPTW